MSIQKLNVLIVDDLHPAFFELISSDLFNITYLPRIQSADIGSALNDQDILILRSKVYVDADLCSLANRLKLVVRAGSGLDNLDTKWLSENDILFFNTAESNAQAVAEQTLGMLLNLMANIGKADREIRNGTWNREANRGDELEGKTVGIVGFGHTGSRFAKLLSGFGVQILAYDKYKSGFGYAGVKEADMNEIFSEADIVSLHIPLTEETVNMVNSHYINQFSKPLRLLNLSRGRIVNIEHIIEAIETKKIMGFGADVLPNERLSNLNAKELKELDQLRAFANVLLTPHIGGWTHQSYEKISINLAKKLHEYYPIGLEKIKPINV